MKIVYWKLTLALYIASGVLLFNGCTSDAKERAVANEYIGRWVVVDAFVHDDILLENFRRPYKSGDQDQVEELVWDIETAFIGRVYDLRGDGSCMIYLAGDSIKMKWEYKELSDGTDRAIFFKRDNGNYFEGWDLFVIDYSEPVGCCIEGRVTTPCYLYPSVLPCERAKEFVLNYSGFESIELKVEGGMKVYSGLGQGLRIHDVMEFIRVELKKESTVSSISELKKQHRHRNLDPTLNAAMYSDPKDLEPDF